MTAPDHEQAERLKRLNADLDAISFEWYRDGFKEQSDVIQDAMNELSALAAQLEGAQEQRKIDREEFQIACQTIDRLEKELDLERCRGAAAKRRLGKL